jgi:predicted ATP-grasp superfamily ATP-dependent carboligase
MNTQTFEATAQVYYLPNPSEGSVTKMDLRTGALLAKPANGSGGDYETVFPIGFYTTYDGYLASNTSVLDELKAQG